MAIHSSPFPCPIEPVISEHKHPRLNGQRQPYGTGPINSLQVLKAAMGRELPRAVQHGKVRYLGNDSHYVES